MEKKTEMIYRTPDTYQMATLVQVSNFVFLSFMEHLKNIFEQYHSILYAPFSIVWYGPLQQIIIQFLPLGAAQGKQS